ncbi:uncharacterized protein LOC143593388 [Bidens hawaiensis]|uniref:uncharacterized protein LOC143593388 n=1 Tax=Bidens hawaiensis TaxID=980011 RepID=UPI004049B162
MSDVVAREREKKTMLTAFFEKNQTDTSSRAYLYRDFPKFFTWNGRLGRWNRRTRKTQRGRIVSANPAEGKRYYLRLLLTHVRGPTSFDDLQTVNGVQHTTFRKTALEMGLIDDDTTLSQCLAEAAVFNFPMALQRLFAIILKFCRPGDVRQLWTTHYDNLSEDHRRNSQNNSHIQDMVLNEIGNFLHSMGKTLQQYDLPRIMHPMNFQTTVQREIQEEYSIVVDPSHLQAQNSLNTDQKYIFDKIMSHVNSDIPGVYFVDGPGGTGKTFLYKALLAEVRSRGLLALATASSGAAANNMLGRRTAHSRFNIPIHLDTNSTCNIPM